MNRSFIIMVARLLGANYGSSKGISVHITQDSPTEEARRIEAAKEKRRIKAEKRMANSLYRCGWCGNPTTKSGEVLELTASAVYSRNWDSALPVVGHCCAVREM